MKISFNIISFIFIFTFLQHNVECARILGIFPMPCKSHVTVFTALTQELARRGHELVVMTAFPLSNPPDNYTQINFMPTIKDYYEENMRRYDLYSFDLPLHAPLYIWIKGTTLSEMISQDQGVQNLLHDKNGFDLVICEDLIAEALCAFADYFKAPSIMMSSLGGYHMVNYAVGNPIEPSYVPNVAMPYTHHMTLSQRLKNLLLTLFWDFGNQIYYLPRQEYIRKKMFGDNTSSVWDLRHTASLVLLNNHFSLNYPRPLLPAVVEVGGLHLKQKPDPLPQDLQEFLDGAKNGAIYFSMGSILRSDALSPERLRSILAAFSELPQRVLMKWESDTLPGQPPNVKICKWLPQQDILAHPNIRVFVTHGGLLSTQEAVFHGVPLVGIPVFADQALNMNKAVQAGYGVMIAPLSNLTKNSLLWGIKKSMKEPRIRHEAKYRSLVFRDQPETPLERAVFWTEYVIRHGGAPQLRSASLDLAWYQRLMLDAILALVLGSIIFCVSLREILHFFRRSVHRDSTKKVQ